MRNECARMQADVSEEEVACSGRLGGVGRERGAGKGRMCENAG